MALLGTWLHGLEVVRSGVGVRTTTETSERMQARKHWSGNTGTRSEKTGLLLNASGAAGGGSPTAWLCNVLGFCCVIVLFIMTVLGFQFRCVVMVMYDDWLLWLFLGYCRGMIRPCMMSA